MAAWSCPLGRWIVPRPDTRPRWCACLWETISGFQIVVHAPVQVVCPFGSLAISYSGRCDATRTVPSPAILAVPTTDCEPEAPATVVAPREPAKTAAGTRPRATTWRFASRCRDGWVRAASVRLIRELLPFDCAWVWSDYGPGPQMDGTGPCCPLQPVLH